MFNLSKQGPPSPIYPTAASRTPDLYNDQDVSYSPVKQPMGYSQQYRLDLQYQIGDRLLVDVAYVGNKALKIPFTRDINQVPASLLGPGDAQPRRPFPEYQSIDGTSFVDIQNYNSLQTRIKRQFSTGLTLEANYTYAKAMDTMTVAASGSASSTWQNVHNVMGDYGLSSIDMRHTFTGYAVYQLPVGRGRPLLNRSGVLNGILGMAAFVHLPVTHRRPVHADDAHQPQRSAVRNLAAEPYRQWKPGGSDDQGLVR